MSGLIERKKVSLQVLDYLKEMIQQEPYVNGEKLPSEMELVERFQVSRAPIREALTVLTAMDVIESKQGGGRWVKDHTLLSMMEHIKLGMVTIDEVHSLLEMRHIIETEAAALAASRATPDEILALEQALIAFSETVVSKETIGNEADSHFHFILVKAAKNPFLTATLENMKELLDHAIEFSLRLNMGKVEKRRNVYEEHKAIYEAIAAKNATAAREAMNTHLVNVRKKLGDSRI
ncbi:MULTISPECIES: FadR/GntR family transcriptional regulator [Bacillaceae]|uniref:GntR family transcriptional regulator n=2 Tax=Bacillaceae TaxID=186817 RepID=A0A9D5HYM2_9BACI|nr:MULTISPECIES: FCD domain-containing protein [Bacillaceae]KQL57906.1 GntR family transcriptional regulator [Alkalicoccobacillus plakortidis]MBG9785797.1 GntR family transcriptional regulator [Shouchella lehensis]RQW20088.1 FadR family transcriptional regulator [Bacillus sp. C1-1]TES48266.1 FadR family transcriptional regulator [Shouchella lehensis]